MAELKSFRKSAERCPICGRAASAVNRPFCTPRCAEVDLGRWLTGAYRIEGPPLEFDEDAASSDGTG